MDRFAQSTLALTAVHKLQEENHELIGDSDPKRDVTVVVLLGVVVAGGRSTAPRS